MKLSCALVACNEKTHYLNFWPVVKHAWNSIVHIPCKLIYVAESLHPSLVDDPDVIFFKAIPEWPTATQAQCIRLLYPALLQLPDNGAVMISDMDMVPMQSDFFVNGFANFNETQFVSLRGTDEPARQIYMCYVGAAPAVWGEVFGIKQIEDVQVRMREWAQRYRSNGMHGKIPGSDGWFWDQILLYYYVKKLPSERFGMLPNVPIPRVDRDQGDVWESFSDSFQKDVKDKQFVDFHMPPFNTHTEIINNIINTAASNL
jgi:hypothetical protein